MIRIEERQSLIPGNLALTLVGLIAAVSASVLVAAVHAPEKSRTSASSSDPAPAASITSWIAEIADQAAVVRIGDFPVQSADRGRTGAVVDAPTF